MNPFVPIAELMRRLVLRTLLIIQCLFTFVVMGYNSATPVLLIERFGVQPMNLAALLVVVGVANVVVQAGAIYDCVAPGAPFLSGAILLVLGSALLTRVRAAPVQVSHIEAYR
jgi:hypothetical protein